MPISSKLTTLLSTEIPIVSAPMYYASTPQMAAATTLAGGFGFIAAGFSSSLSLIGDIHTARAILHTPPSDPVPIGVGFLGWILDSTECSEDPRLLSVLGERPKAVWLAFGEGLGRYVRVIREFDQRREEEGYKTVIFVIVNSLDEARTAVHEWRVDVLVVQGNEAGGHGRGDAPPLRTLLSSILSSFPDTTPNRPAIIAAGGISSSSQIASLLSPSTERIGADGVVLGSRLLCTPECMYPPQSKSILLSSRSSSSPHSPLTTRSTAFDQVNRTAFWPPGIDGRAISNAIISDAHAGLDLPERLRRFDEGKARGESERVVIWAGEAVREIREGESTQSVVRGLFEEAVVEMEGLL